MFAKTNAARAKNWCRLLGVCGVIVSACGGDVALNTLDGKKPMVVAHRGASGYVPEQTYEA